MDGRARRRIQQLTLSQRTARAQGRAVSAHIDKVAATLLNRPNGYEIDYYTALNQEPRPA